MSNGYSFLICGSGPITISHLKALKTFKKIYLKKIYSKNYSAAKNLSLSFNLKVIKKLDPKNIKDCNACLITTSSEKHFRIIKKLSNYISFFIVEKPLVETTQEIKKLIKLKKKKNLKIFEVSQFLFFDKIRKLNLVKRVEILINKKRISKDYENYKKIKNKNKSIIFRQLPHWYDVAKKITGRKLKFTQLKFKITKNNLSNLELKLLNYNLDVIIKINLNCSKNYPPQIFTNKGNFIIKENFIKKIILNNQLTLTENNLINMYTCYLSKSSNKRCINCYDTNKYILFDKLFKLTRNKKNCDKSINL